MTGFPPPAIGGAGWAWQGRPEPIIGPDAGADLRKLREQHGRWLAKRLTSEVRGLLDRQPSRYAVRVCDPPGVGPRYWVDLGNGYVVVYWVLEPPPEARGAGPVLWVERVLSWDEVREALEAMVPDE